MHSSIAHHFLSGQKLSDAEARSLLKAARTLRTLDTASRWPLAGRHVAVAAAAGAVSKRIGCFEEAARGLGAQVSHIAPEALAPGHGAAWNRLLGRLYDAIDCDDLPSDAAMELERTTGVPVFQSLEDSSHPLRRLLALEHAGEDLDESASHDELVRLVQAVLVEALA